MQVGTSAGRGSKAEAHRRKREKRKAKKAASAGEASGVDEDRQHYADVCYSLLSYKDDAEAELRYLAESFIGITDPHDRELLRPDLGIALLPEMRRCALANASFLATLVQSDEDAREFWEKPLTHVVQERNSSKVRTVLRQLVRDWADEGQQERETQYGVLLKALERFAPLPSDPNTSAKDIPRVLSPGSGLARLPLEVARLGYHSQGNEFSYHMLQGSKWVLNETWAPKVATIYPYVLAPSNRTGARDHLRGITIPDICPSQVLCGVNGDEPLQQEFSMCAGEFVDVYADQIAEWDAVLTCFFLDTAKNVFLYIRTIAHILRPNGLWANIGPLLFHYAEQPDTVSIELAWDEVRPAICKYFDFREEETHKAAYTTNTLGMTCTQYRCVYFAAIRNTRPVDGTSYPVF